MTEIKSIQIGSTTYDLRDDTKVVKSTTVTTKDQFYTKTANGGQTLTNIAVANSTGKDSVVNVTTDDGVSRTNTAGGAYSVAFGSRNIIGSSASESGAFGGDIHINSENTYGFGYHVWAHSNQNLLGGYDVGSNAKESLIYGNTIGIDCTHNSSTHTWTANSTTEANKSKYLMVFGDHHTVGSKALSDLIVGSTHTVGNNLQYSVLSGKSQTIGDNVEYVNVFGGSGNKLGENGNGLSDCTVFGYQNTLYGGTYSTSSGTNKIDNVYIMGSHNANSKNTTSSNFKHSVWMFGHYLAPVENGQFIIGEYNKTSSNNQPNAYFLVGTGNSSTRRTSFAVCYNGTYGSHIYIGNTRIAESGSNISVNGTNVSLSGHTHSASDITSGTLGIARIPTGSSTSTSSSYVVKCNDSRLSNARNAADVYAWAKASTKPSYTLDEVTDGTTRKLSDYALATHNHDSTYLGKTATATDSSKLNGQAASYYAKATDIPSAYIKSASSSSNTLTLTKQDNTTVTYTPSFTDTNYYHTPAYSSGLKIGTGTGVNDMYVPNGSTTAAGVLQIGTSASNAAAGNHNHDSSYLGKTATAADSSKLNGQSASYYATSTHNHDSTYLGISAKAADSSKLNGQSASYYQVALPTTTTAGKVLKSTSTAGSVTWGDAGGGGGSTLYRHNLKWIFKTGSSSSGYIYTHFYAYLITNSSTAYTYSAYFGSINTLFKKTVLCGGLYDYNSQEEYGYDGISTLWRPNYSKSGSLNQVFIKYARESSSTWSEVQITASTIAYSFTDTVETF